MSARAGRLARRPGRELGRRHRPVAVRVDRGHLLECWDLGHVHHVVDPDLPGQHVDAAVPVTSQSPSGWAEAAPAGQRTASETIADDGEATNGRTVSCGSSELLQGRERHRRVLHREVRVDVDRFRQQLARAGDPLPSFSWIIPAWNANSALR